MNPENKIGNPNIQTGNSLNGHSESGSNSSTKNSIGLDNSISQDNSIDTTSYPKIINARSNDKVNGISVENTHTIPSNSIFNTSGNTEIPNRSTADNSITNPIPNSKPQRSFSKLWTRKRLSFTNLHQANSNDNDLKSPMLASPLSHNCDVALDMAEQVNQKSLKVHNTILDLKQQIQLLTQKNEQLLEDLFNERKSTDIKSDEIHQLEFKLTSEMKMMNQLKNELQSQKDLTAKLQLALEYEKNLHRENNIQNQAISNTTTPEDKRISELERKVIDFQIQEKIHLNLIQSEKLKNTALAKELRDERSRQLRLQQKVIPESLSPLSIHRIIPQPNISTSTLEQLAKQIKSHCEFNRDLFTFIKPFLISCKEITQQCDDRISQSFSDQDSIDTYQEQISIYLSKLMKLVKLHHDSENPSMHLDIQNTVDFILNTIVKMVLVIERETFNQVIIDKELESSAMQRLKRLSKRHTTSSLVIHYDPVPDQASLSISQLQKFLKSQIDRLDHEIKPVLDHFSPSDISTQISTISDIVDGILYESRSTSDTYHFNTQHELLELLTLLGDTHLTLLHRCESINTDSGSLSIHDMLLDLLKFSESLLTLVTNE